MSVTPTPGLNTQVVASGRSTLVVPANPSGGVITNPAASTDQGITTAEPLYVDPTGNAPSLIGNGSTFTLLPGQDWKVIPNQTSTTNVTSLTAGHKFSAVYW